MAEGKKSVIIYTSWKIWLDAMTTEQKGMWLEWLMSYTNDEHPSNPNDPVVNMGCMIAKETLKRDLKKYEARVERIKKNGKQYQSQSDNENANSEIGPISVRYQSEVGGVNVNDNVNDNVNVNVSKDSIYIPPAEECTQPKKSSKHKFGEYGRVLLTDEQYQKLVDDYNKEYINSVIKAVDEYLQTNGNKNKYKDFNLVIRKCIRENWSIISNVPKSGFNVNDGWQELGDENGGFDEL